METTKATDLEKAHQKYRNSLIIQRHYDLVAPHDIASEFELSVTQVLAIIRQHLLKTEQAETAFMAQSLTVNGLLTWAVPHSRINYANGALNRAVAQAQAAHPGMTVMISVGVMPPAEHIAITEPALAPAMQA